MKEQCLYLHFDGVRYCFKKDPNVTLLVEQEADVVSRDEDLVRDKIKEMLEARLAGHNVYIWPTKSGEVPDSEPSFIVAYLPLDFGAETKSEQPETRQGHPGEVRRQAAPVPQRSRPGRPRRRPD